MLEPTNYLDVLQHIKSLIPTIIDNFMVDQQVLHRFAKLLKASGINYAKILQIPATIHKDPEDVIVWDFQAHHFPAPLTTMRGSGDLDTWNYGNGCFGNIEIGRGCKEHNGRFGHATWDGNEWLLRQDNIWLSC